jgi:hypothetical protein
VSDQTPNETLLEGRLEAQLKGLVALECRPVTGGHNVNPGDVTITAKRGESRNWDARVGGVSDLIANELHHRAVDPLRGTYDLIAN